MCYVEEFIFDQPYCRLILLPPSGAFAGEASTGVFQNRHIGPGNVRGLHVVITSVGLETTLLYAGLLIRLRPAFNPDRRSIVVGGLAVTLPVVTVLIFGAATAASAAANAMGIGNTATAGAGLPYRVTMPASEIFAYSAEALLLFLLCRPALSARQAVLLSMLANSASLALGLVLL
jgi:hypothetical protein